VVQAQDFDVRDILIGQTIALSGGLAEHGQAVHLGARAYFDAINARGGIRGRRILLKTLDDAGVPSRAADNTAKLIKEDLALAIFGGIEGGPCVASMRVATERRVPLVACLAGSPELREPFNRYVFPVRAPHLAEFEQLIDHSVSFRWQRMGFLYADNDTGRKHLANVERILGRHGLKLAAAIPIPNANPNPEDLAKTIVGAKLDSVFNHGSYALYGDVIRQVRKRQVDGAGVSFLAVNSGAQQLSAQLGEERHGLIFTQVVPYPWRSTPDAAREHRELLKAIAPDVVPSFSSLEGHISAKVLVEGLRGMRGRLTSEELVRSLERLGTLDVGGFTVRYSPDSREGSTFVDMVMAVRRGGFSH
jgi:ABC-type branched-subunit amino acid transport system substrate-binding protein